MKCIKKRAHNKCACESDFSVFDQSLVAALRVHLHTAHIALACAVVQSGNGRESGGGRLTSECSYVFLHAWTKRAKACFCAISLIVFVKKLSTVMYKLQRNMDNIHKYKLLVNDLLMQSFDQVFFTL